MTGDRDIIIKNIDELRSRVAAAAARAGRDPAGIKIVAVTKTVEPGRIMTAYQCGITDFGENRVQELVQKADIMNVECKWHMIGHLQTNKVKYIIDRVCMIHSLDSIELAYEINRRAEKAGRIMDVLVQINVAGESTKYGIEPASAPDFVKEVSRMGNIRIKGLMTIAPLVSDPEEVRWVFRGLRQLLIDIGKENIDNVSMEYLSMGMSNDFEVAIEEGANIIRPGTAIFGKRKS
ncbi:MAG TPA: YggS family pyridoxal phosphate-dependent enzyme [Clostridiales bacterium]|nr:YggS family pyridoxal phosphate-dependent enzyme [Clostridiales bacterium]HOL92228.1 YggS family pyridoxal phosphate-dependent enzyme [Clostridiales bacterium]HPP36161.1 YggS family pyridoxal phosphate-dependent enzyme [Clostridiales bacterium]